MRFYTKKRCTLVALAFVLMMAGFQSHAANTILTVIVEGSQAPGQAPGVTFNSLVNPRAALNSSGQVAFTGSLAGPGISLSNDQIIYRFTPFVGNAKVAQGQDPFPAMPGHFYDVNSPDWLGHQSMNNAGQVVFHAGTSLPAGPVTNRFLIDGTTIVRSAGDPAPGIPGVNIGALAVGNLNNARINNTGQVIYTASLQGQAAGANTALFQSNSLIAREGNAAPGTAANFGNFAGVDNARLNNAGQVVFTVDLDTGVAANNGVVYRNTAGVNTLIARDGDAAPGTGGVLFGSGGFLSPRINASGQTAYLSSLVGGDNVLYRDTTLIARDGTQAPGLPAGVLFNNLGLNSNLEMNNAGTILFGSSLTGPGISGANDAVLYLGSTVLAREGSPSPIASTNFSGFFNFSDMGLNNAGHAVFFGTVTGAGATPANDTALFLWDGSALSVVAREGDALAGSTIASFTGPHLEFNDRGDVLFFASLANGRDGLFLSAAPIPEPSTYLLMLAGLGAIVWKARRRTARAV